MGNERIPWIDIAKGILILIVILHHMPQVADRLLNVDNLKLLEKSSCLYLSYFMPAFFIITGLCTNFNKSFSSFFEKNFRQLIIPSLVFSILLYWIELIISQNYIVSNYFSRIIPIIIWGGIFGSFQHCLLAKSCYGQK